MEKIEAFKTADGQLFADQDKAKLHEMFLKKQDVIEDFLDSKNNPYSNHAQRSIARQTVINWELWKTENAK